jgi:tetratricopeptide (TPR) repeat protein
LYSVGRYVEAINHFLRESENLSNESISKSSISVNEQSVQDAVKLYEQAIELCDWAITYAAMQPLLSSQDYAALYYRKGNLFLMIPDKITKAFEDKNPLAQAIQSFDSAIERCPNMLNAHFNKGLALERSKQYEQALISYNNAIEIDPKHAGGVYVNKAELLSRLGRDEDALSTIDKHSLQDNTTPFALLTKGKVLQKIGCTTYPFECYQTALKISIQDPALSSQIEHFIELQRESIEVKKTVAQLNKEDTRTREIIERLHKVEQELAGSLLVSDQKYGELKSAFKSISADVSILTERVDVVTGQVDNMILTDTSHVGGLLGDDTEADQNP